MGRELRFKRIENQVLHTISLKALQANDERIKRAIITRITIERDLKNINVFFKVFLLEGKEDTLKALRNAEGFFKMALKERGIFKYIPHINFFYDEI